MIHLRALQPDDAPEYRRCLTDAADDGVSLSFGVFDGDRLVGHLVCCGFKPTLFPGEIGEALHVRHVAVLPRYRRMLPRLIRRFGAEARRHYPGSSIEASVLESALGIWRAHPTFFAREGYALTRHADSGEMLNGEIRHLVRWQPIPDWEPVVSSLAQLVAPPRGRLVVVDGVRYETAVVKVEREWDALAPEWRQSGRAGELFVVLLVREGAVLAVAPLQLEIVKVYGRWCRRLSFIGANSGGERPRLLFAADAARLARGLVAALAARRDQWDLCDFTEELDRGDGAPALGPAFRAARFLVSASGSRLLVSRRTPFFLAAHAFGFRLQLGWRSWREALPHSMLPARPQLTLRSWRPDDQT